MFASEYIVLIVACCLWRFDLDFRDFNKKVGLELSDTKMGKDDLVLLKWILLPRPTSEKY